MRQVRFALLFTAIGLVACGDSSPSSPSEIGGNFRLMITDSPFSDAKAVLVTFSDVFAHRAGDGGVSTLRSRSRTCDLKKLQGPQDVLAVGIIQAGHYTFIRLAVTSAKIYFDNASVGAACADVIPEPGGRNASIEIPSGETRLNREFNVSTTGVTTMVLDFDGDKSIRETGNGRYMMTPVITVESVQQP
jgi:hypothetical protein